MRLTRKSTVIDNVSDIPIWTDSQQCGGFLDPLLKNQGVRSQSDRRLERSSEMVGTHRHAVGETLDPQVFSQVLDDERAQSLDIPGPELAGSDSSGASKHNE